MHQFSSRVAGKKVERDTLAIYWLAQAGFAFKSPSGFITYIDPYFSDVVERRFGFKRLMSCPLSAEDVEADLFVCTHEHLDHMDIDSLPTIARNGGTHFAGPIECYKFFRSIGIPEVQCHLLEEGKTTTVGSVEMRAVYADHGKLAEDALGVVLDIEGIRVYHTGDTAYRPEQFAPAVAMKPHILLPCINGMYGNMDAREAALLTKSAQPELVIPTHFGMFTEHNGDPELFLKLCAELAPEVGRILLAPGDEYIFSRHTGPVRDGSPVCDARHVADEVKQIEG